MDKTENELIAEFMGIDFTAKDAYLNYAPPICKKFGLYDRSWDWLMPVVEKIGKIELPDGQYGKYIDFSISSNDGIGWIFWTKNVPGDQNQPQSYPTEGTMIEKTHKAVVEFIKWYNSQKS